MIGAIIKTSLILGTLFSLSTLSTVAITKQLNKTPVKNTTNVEKTNMGDEDEMDDGFPDSDYIVPRELTDTEKFINSLTSFGNLEANLEASICIDDINIYLNGDVFVSLESLEELSLSLDLDVTINDFTTGLQAAYINNNIYLDLLGNKIMLSTNKITDLISLIGQYLGPIELPETFSNIDSDALLNNLGSMTSDREDNQIVYECNLLPGLPAITFTSDLSFNLTSVSLENFNIEGIKGSVYGDVHVLGKGNNQIVEPDSSLYLDVSKYFGLVDQIATLVDKKQFGLNYNLSINNSSNAILSSKGSLDLDLNGLKLALSSTFTIKDLDLNIDASYINDKVYFSYNNKLNLSYSVEKMIDLFSIVSTNLGEEALSSLLNKLSNISMPLITYIKDKDYLKLLNHFDSLSLDENNIQLTIANNLFGDSNTNTSINVGLEQDKVNSLSITNLEVLGFAINLNVDLVNFNDISIPNENDYVSLDNVNGLVSDIFSLTKQTKFAVNLDGSITTESGATTFSGDTQFDISTLSGSGRITILDKNNTSHRVAIDVFDDSTLYFSYNDNLNGKMTLKSLRDVLSTVLSLAESGNARVQKYVDMILTNTSDLVIKEVLDGNYLALLEHGVIESISYSNYEYTIELNGELLGEENNIIIILKTNDNDSLKGLSLSASIMGINLSINASLGEYKDDYGKIDFTGKKIYDFSELSTLVDYVLTTAEENDFTLSGTLSLDLNAIGIIHKSFDLGFKILVHINEDESVISKLSITNIPNIKLVGINVLQSEEWIDRTFDIYIGDEYVNLQTISINEETKMGKNIFDWNKYRITTTQSVHLTSKEMIDNLLYYFVTFGLGIDKFDLSSAVGDSGSTAVDYSKLISNYEFHDGTNPSWDIGINLSDLIGNDMLSDVNATIVGNNENHLLSTLNAYLNVNVLNICTIDIALNAALTSVDYIGDNAVNSINAFNDLCLTFNNREIIKSVDSIKL